MDVTAQIVGDPALLSRALDVVLRAPDVDVVVVALAMVNRMYPVDRIVGDLLRVSGASARPVFVSWVSGAPEGAAAIHAAGLPVFTDTTRCLTALAALARLPDSPCAATDSKPP